jgi:hypothetical protein
MSGRAIFYLGDSEFAAGFCNKLEAYACCGDLTRHDYAWYVWEEGKPVRQ